jgi:tetratricopeptide (TPR) repeat protein
MMRRFRNAVATLILATLASVPARAQWVLQSGEMDKQIHRALPLMYNMDFAAAESIADSIIAEGPDHPAGYFYKASSMFWRTVTNPDNTRYDEEYKSWLGKAIDKADALLEKNPRDIAGLFYKGAAIGMRARMYEYRVSAADAFDIVQLILGDARNSVKYLDQLEDIIPDNPDVLFGRGVYNYYVEAEKEQNPTLAPIIGTMFPTGSKAVGLQMLEISAKNAMYAQVEAKFELMHIYYAIEKNYQKAFDLARDLASRYPNNVQFLHYLGFCAVTENNIPLYDSVYRVMLDRSRQKRDAYTIRQAREAMYFLGLAQMKKTNGNMDTALYYFYNSDLLSRTIEKDPDKFDWWLPAAELAMAEAYDNKGDRKDAILMYKRVLGLPDHNSSHSEATRYLSTPYKR